MLQNKGTEKLKKLILKVAIPLFWLGVWQGVFCLINKEILIASPAEVFSRLKFLTATTDFWKSIFFSFLRIISGYFLGVVFGVVLAVVTSFSSVLKELFHPIISLGRATPVASFIILALVWIKKDYVPVFIVLLIVFPIVYSNVSKAIEETPKTYLESAKVYGFSFFKKVRAIYFHSVLPLFSAACVSSLGLAWKSGVAAEVLAMPQMSVGYNLYRSKINIETADLFAWTAVVVVLSVLLEKLIKLILKENAKRKKRSVGNDETDS